MIEYNGWAPCCHCEEDKIKITEWFNKFIPERLLEQPYSQTYSLLEGLLFELNIIGAIPTLFADQWTQVVAEGEITGKKIKTSIQGDTFLISVAETYRWWKEKYKELTGKEYD